MDSLFNDLCTGLKRAIEYKKGNGSARKVHILSPL